MPAPHSLWPTTPVPAWFEWNPTNLNWRRTTDGKLTLFHVGDSVEFTGTTNVFIGSGGLPGAVAPANTRMPGTQAVTGGDILTGGTFPQRCHRVLELGGVALVPGRNNHAR